MSKKILFLDEFESSSKKLQKVKLSPKIPKNFKDPKDWKIISAKLKSCKGVFLFDEFEYNKGEE